MSGSGSTRQRPRAYRSPRQRRATAALLVLLLLMVALAAGAVWWFFVRDPAGTATAGAERCPTPVASRTAGPAAAVPAPRAVRLNVYNATERQGLAATTASGLRARGFVVGRVANDPLRKTVAKAAEVRHGPKGAAAARLVAAHAGAPGTVVVVADRRADPSVDLVLGNGFTALQTPAKVTAALRPAPSARPSGC